MSNSKDLVKVYDLLENRNKSYKNISTEDRKILDNILNEGIIKYNKMTKDPISLDSLKKMKNRYSEFYNNVHDPDVYLYPKTFDRNWNKGN